MASNIATGALSRTRRGRVVQRHVLYLGEINDTQELAWRRSIEVLEDDGKARRVWLMDRGVPTEEVLAEMRATDPPVHYLVGTPKGRLTRLERHLIAKPWQEARPGAQVKLLPQEGELYVLAQSRDRVAKERAMRRRQLKRLWARLKQLSTMEISREELLMKLGAARDQSRSAWRMVVIEVAADSATFSYRLDRNKLRQARSREGRYLLRTNLVEEDPAKLWSHYLLKRSSRAGRAGTAARAAGQSARCHRCR
jgi:hypothetical protein